MSIFLSALMSSGALFLPIYIYSTTGSVASAILYAALSYGFFRVVSKPFNLWIMNWLSVEHGLLFSIFFLSLAYGTVYLVGVGWPLVLAVALFEAMGFSLYWDSYHVSFGIFGRQREIGKELAGAYIVSSIVSLLMPFLSAVVVKLLGFHVFYTLVAGISVLGSVLVALNFKALYKTSFSLKKVIIAPLKLFHSVEGVHLTSLNLAPFFIFLVFRVP